MDDIEQQIIEWLLAHKSEIINETDSFKIVRKIKCDLDVTRSQVSNKLLFDTLFPEKIITCENARFVSFAVGYRTCSKSCDCYIKRVSESTKYTKSLYTDEKRKEIQQKREETNLERYGVTNAALDTEVRKRISTSLNTMSDETRLLRKQRTIQTNQQRYGVDNVMQVPEIVEKNQQDRDIPAMLQKQGETMLARYGDAHYRNPEKAKQTNLDRYGEDNPSKSPAIRKKISNALRSRSYRLLPQYDVIPNFEESEYQPGIEQLYTCTVCGTERLRKISNGKASRCLKCFPYSKSTEEQKVKDFLQSLNINFISNSLRIIKPKEIDIFIPEYNLGIEYCGTYFHTEQRGKDKWYHWNKMIAMDKLGFKLITLFSDQWYYHQDIIESRLMTMLNLNEQIYYARKCKVFQITPAKSSEFMIQNHLQGATKSKYNFGLYHDNELLACMEISPSRFQKQILELTRFAVKKHVSVIGGASKLFSHFIRLYDPTEIVSYSDNCWGLTDFYQKLGFTRKSIGTPGYTYIHNSKPLIRHNRMTFQKHKLPNILPVFDVNQTEYENMLRNNYDKIWDCGHSVWQWSKT